MTGLSDTDISAWAGLIRVSRQLVQAVEDDLKSAGHPPLSWYDALLELRRAEPDGLRPFQLQQEMLLAQYNLSRLIDRLVESGLVIREVCKSDGRGHVLYISKRGRTTVKKMWVIYRNAIERNFRRKLDDREISNLCDTLKKLKR